MTSKEQLHANVLHWVNVLEGNKEEEENLTDADLLEAGVYAFMRWSHLCAFPPLNISQEELHFGLSAFDSALTQLDQRLGF